MRRVFAIFKRELKAYFVLPIAYVILGLFVGLTGYYYFTLVSNFFLLSVRTPPGPDVGQILNVSERVLRPLFSNVSFILLLLLPVLTMRLFAEEKKSGTAELLFTYPLRDGEVLLGKFLAAVAIFILMLGFLLLGVFYLAYLTSMEKGPIFTGFLGLFLQGIAFLAVGTLASSLTENQIVAAVTALGVLLLFWIIGWTAYLFAPPFDRIIQHLSVIEQFTPFAGGIIESKAVIFYLNLTFFFLFLTLQSLSSKRWRG